VTPSEGRLARLLARGEFVVTGEIVPPRAGTGDSVTDHARGLVGYVDAVNITDNPTASAHMSPLAGVALAARAGLEPTVQMTVRDRNRLALAADLLGAWALGARNVFCLTGDPMHVGDDPEAPVVGDLTVAGLIAMARSLRDEGLLGTGSAEVDDPPRYTIGAAEVPFADPYDPAKLEAKLDAGADFVMTQIVYDAERLGEWADRMRPLGVFERTAVIVGVTPLRSAAQARFMDERLPGVSVPPTLIEALDRAGDEAADVGLDQAVTLVEAVRAIDGVAGIHIMAMGRDHTTRTLVERSGLFPRPA
jgi:methylenetetrahydrofolate reductase (NADPH)